MELSASNRKIWLCIKIRSPFVFAFKIYVQSVVTFEFTPEVSKLE